MFEEYLPKGVILFWSIVLSCARFENQRWVRARKQGLRGSNEAVGAIIDLTYLIGLVLMVAVVALSFFDFGWKQTVGLIVLTMLAGWVWAAVGAFVAATVTPPALWIAGTVLVYLAVVPLLLQFSWFGLLR
jgi:hypothetical protein